MKKKILISTGGSGGHVLLALTIYDHLKNEYDMFISSDQRGLKYFEEEKYKPFIVDTPKIKISIFFPFVLLKVFLLTIKSLSILKKEKISILISTGGYMSLPLCFAAKILGIKIYLIEPNMVLGRAKHNGNDIYPPVEIKIDIFSFFKILKDFIVNKNTFKSTKGKKIEIFIFGVSTIKGLYFSSSKYFKPL
jgi:UDP-N-acetylglucosamine:LPS N-acetylglucosamine transferase